MNSPMTSEQNPIRTRRTLGVLAVVTLLSLATVPANAATWTVCTTGLCDFTMIQTAIDDAAVVNGDTIGVDAGLFVEAITIHKDLTLIGSGQASTTLTFGGGTVVTIATGVTAGIRRVTITGGAGIKGGGVNNAGVLVMRNVTVSDNWASAAGGGIWTEGPLLLHRVTVSDNIVDDVLTGIGGGLFVDGLLGGPGTVVFVNRSTISGNQACQGGGVYNNQGRVGFRRTTVRDNVTPLTANCIAPHANGAGILNLFSPNFGATLVLRDTTVSNNVAGYAGGGIANLYGGTVILTSSTITGNEAGTSGGGVYVDDWNEYNSTVVLNNVTVTDNASGNLVGAGVHVSGSTNPADPDTIVSARNSIVADQAGAASDCFGTNTSFVSDGYNIESGTTCDFVAFGFGDQQNTSPALDPLADNGGPTETHALPAGSAAVDTGNPAGCSADTNGNGTATVALPEDQRGQPRVGICDVGALERQ